MSSSRRIWPIPGGLNLPAHKSRSTSAALRDAGIPPELIMPLQQHIGQEAVPVVAVGDRVLRGQVIAAAHGYLSAAVNAPTSGTVSAIEDRPVPHPSGLNARCIVIATDGRDEASPTAIAAADIDNMDPASMRAALRQLGIVGLGGAAFPAAVKLNQLPQNPVHTLILNGAECEPYISCDDTIMRVRSAEIISGARIMLRMLGCRECLIAVESDKVGAIAAMQAATQDAGDERIEVITVPTVYPEGGEKQLIQVLTGKEVPSGGLTAEIGVVCHNVATAAQVKRALMDGEALTSRIVTVTGDGVDAPANLEARLGTPVSWLIGQCGGYTKDVSRLIMGGPMMGFALEDDAVPVVKATNCILAAAAHEVHAGGDAMPCIRCGECARVCPVGLLPQQLYWYARSEDTDALQDHHLFDCIECGCCAYACPSHIPLVQYYRAAKSLVWTEQQDRQRADAARRRFESREQRLEEAKRQREARLAEKKKAVRSRRGSDPVADAVERARAKKKRRRDDTGQTGAS